MSFASPIWLIGLIPWAALAAWLLIGRREEARVPFVHLWPTTAAPVRKRRAVQLPPIAMVCLLLAVLLAVLAAARPYVWRRADALDVTLVVDLAVTSPVKDAHDFGVVPAKAVLVDGESAREVNPSDWSEQTRTLRSVNTQPALRGAVDDALARGGRAVVVLSNQRLTEVDPARVIQITSASPPQNVGVARVAARGRQVMVTVRNQSVQTRAELVVTSDGHAQRQPVELPPSPGEKNFFVDLPALGRVVSVELVTRDDIGVDNRAWLVRQPGTRPCRPRSPRRTSGRTGRVPGPPRPAPPAS